MSEIVQFYQGLVSSHSGYQYEEILAWYDNKLEKRINHLIAHPHNYLRITRILKSLQLLGLEEQATLFFTVLSYIYRQQIPRISAETYGYWQRAMTLITPCQSMVTITRIYGSWSEAITVINP